MKKMKNSGWIILLCFFLILLGCCYFIYSTYQTIEALRTVPLPSRHPYPTEYINRPVPNLSDVGINENIDYIISQYFDENRLPYQNAINSFEAATVDQGNVSNETLYKLMDICYYVWDIVLPNIPTLDNPKPKMSWPKIKWVSEKWLRLDQTYNTIRISNSALNYYNVDNVKRLLNSASSPKPNENKVPIKNSDIARLNGFSTDSMDDSSIGSSNSKPPCSGTIGGSCEIQCPTSCMSNQFTQQNTQAGSSGRSGNRVDGTNQSLNWDYFQRMMNGFLAGLLTNHLGKDRIFQPQYGDGSVRSFGYYVTNRPQTVNSQALETMLKNQISELFEPSGRNQNAPTQNLLNLFDYYTKGQSPADDYHIKKLKSLIYYVMQRIIPGLPTNNRPTTYVIWKPL
jgi:hypothetical protein